MNTQYARNASGPRALGSTKKAHLLKQFVHVLRSGSWPNQDVLVMFETGVCWSRRLRRCRTHSIMPFGLIIGTERASALQKSIQDELTARSFSPDADPVMAEYITIMIINNKTAAQITSELMDLIGSDFVPPDPSFTDWLFAEAAKGAPESEAPSAASSTP
ncbi:uncharacterized protein BJ212DRAFT_1295515, partial [Suillus subaureus]